MAICLISVLTVPSLEEMEEDNKTSEGEKYQVNLKLLFTCFEGLRLELGSGNNASVFTMRGKSQFSLL